MECSHMKHTAEDARNQLSCGWGGKGGGREKQEELDWGSHSGFKGRWKEGISGTCQLLGPGFQQRSPSGKERQTSIHLKGRAQPMGEEGNGLSSGVMTGKRKV